MEWIGPLSQYFSLPSSLPFFFFFFLCGDRKTSAVYGAVPLSFALLGSSFPLEPKSGFDIRAVTLFSFGDFFIGTHRRFFFFSPPNPCSQLPPPLFLSFLEAPPPPPPPPHTGSFFFFFSPYLSESYFFLSHMERIAFFFAPGDAKPPVRSSSPLVVAFFSPPHRIDLPRRKENHGRFFFLLPSLYSPLQVHFFSPFSFGYHS